MRAALAAFTCSCAYAPASLAAPVSDIAIGTHVDLSGPLSSWGRAVRNGLVMAIAEANSQGGVNGRRLRLVVRDDGYQPDTAVAAVRNLITNDSVLAILSPLGTPTTHAAMKEALSRGVPYLFPLSASEETYIPLESLKFSLVPSHAVEVQQGLSRLMDMRQAKRVGVLSADDDLGHEVEQGVINELMRRDGEQALTVRPDKDENPFDGALAKLKAQDVELVVLGVQGAQALQVMRAAAEMRWKPQFLCSSACYEAEFATLAGTDGDGLYAVSQVPIPYPNDPKLGPWITRYEARFSAVPNVHALAAYRNARLFLDVLKEAGGSATPSELAHLLETRGAWTDPLLGGLLAEFSATDHLGSHASLLTQIKKGRWIIAPDAQPELRRSVGILQP